MTNRKSNAVFGFFIVGIVCVMAGVYNSDFYQNWANPAIQPIAVIEPVQQQIQEQPQAVAAPAPVVDRTSWDAQYREIAQLQGKTYVLSDITIEWMDIVSGLTPTQTYYKVCLQGTAYYYMHASGVLTPSYVSGVPEKCSTKK